MEASYFVSCIEKNERPVNDGASGMRVVKLLEACNESLKRNGQEIAV
jgi:hypothetical protein